MRHPLLYEVNTRPWMHELAERAGRALTLAEVPTSEFQAWAKWGFTHIWLMGVWTTGPLARARALEEAEQRKAYSDALPGWQEQDVGGSPYALAEYEVASVLGGENALAAFRERLHGFGLKLVLDFVPNHLGLDHPWVRTRPELFVHSRRPAPETLPVQCGSPATASPEHCCWLAHGKDPNFAAWSDTVQLDYRRPATRTAMAELLLKAAKRCDGLRCDMAMLILNDVFGRTWQRFPSPEPAPADEFWSSAIAAVRAFSPQFMFLAEAYWGLEPRLQSLGFDYTYDKALYDKLLARDPLAVQRHLLSMSPTGLAASAHFLENHDERRIASEFSVPEHRAAALVILSLPGMRFLHEGQLTGARMRLPVQLVRRRLEPEDPEIKGMYEQLLTPLSGTAVGQGRGELLAPIPHTPGDAAAQDFVVTQWQAELSSFCVAAANLAPRPGRCRVWLTIPDSSGTWAAKNLLGAERGLHRASDLKAKGLDLELSGHGVQLLEFKLQP